MLRNIFMKEWLKTRMAVVLVFVASLGLCAYLLIDAHRLIAINGVMPVWDTLLERDTLLLELLEFVPLIAGILLGCTQMLPEMLQKRIKLTLHLPIENWKAIGIMVLYGVIIMLGLLVLNIGLCYAVLQIWLPTEMLRHIFLTVLVWYVAGISFYGLDCSRAHVAYAYRRNAVCRGVPADVLRKHYARDLQCFSTYPRSIHHPVCRCANAKHRTVQRGERTIINA